MSKTDDDLEYSKGFNRGNYGNAYESQDWETWSERNRYDSRSVAYQEGMLLGFFSSYQLHEISDELLREQVEALRIKRGLVARSGEGEDGDSD